MAKIKKMMELEENGDEQQFFPQTHADAVLDLHEYLKKYVIPGAINGKVRMTLPSCRVFKGRQPIGSDP